MQCLAFGYNFTNSFDILDTSPSLPGRSSRALSQATDAWFVCGGKKTDVKLQDGGITLLVCEFCSEEDFVCTLQLTRCIFAQWLRGFMKFKAMCTNYATASRFSTRSLA